ncbi:MAG: flavodoxin domain-containing protein [Liquorilactobacillus ghanensis]|uniref:flavodoxin domain-containing protein n=1 Tax=Liquorilactobacillus ghanensis TaxID=399370 RepID=UPI0039ED50DA
MKAKIAVIYKSTYGHTKKYAAWISEALGADLFKKAAADSEMLKQYDIIIYGGSLYASKINGIEFVAKNQSKCLVVFTVGLTDPQTTDFADIMTNSFSNPNIQPDKVFHFRGGLQSDKLGFIHRNLLKLLRVAVAKKPDSELSEIEKIIKHVYGKNVDYTDKETIQPLINYVKEELT